MSRLFSRSIFFVFLLFAVKVACAALEVKERIDYYTISGSTAREMLKSLNSNGVRQGNKIFHGYTNAWVRWEFDYHPQGDVCTLRNIRVQLKVVLTLPKWNKPYFADKKLVNKWESYIKALTLHEYGHQAISIKGAKAIEQALNNMGPDPNCKALGARANQTARAIMKRIQKKQRAYDVATDHGRTQGAWFR